MCGIAGLYNAAGWPAAEAARAMAERLRHRGPDDGGVWSEGPLALAHRRLAVIDLSPAGHQPMASACGRYVIVFNGEIYNHRELRARLADHLPAGGWRGHSDTETLLAAVAAWGFEATLRACVGMFAIALWDRQAQRLFLARDRMGEKPLYYGRIGGAFGFASEPAAFRAVPGFNGTIDRQALAGYLRLGCVAAPRSIYQGIAKLPAGHWLCLAASELGNGALPAPRAYWSLAEVAERGMAAPQRYAGDAAAADALEAVLRQSVRAQMVADVPLGAFLSGGIDSSTVVALMQAEARASGGPAARSFAIGFREDGYDEAAQAAAVARHLGTEHHELYVGATDALAVIPQLAGIYSEPFADSSQIPTFLVARMARQQVTVALSGDAGDELFAGYRRHFLAARWWPRLAAVPRPLRQAAAAAALGLSPAAWNRLLGRWLRLPGDKIHKAARLMASADGAALYRGLVSQWQPEVLGLAEEDATAWPAHGGLAERMMLADGLGYLADDILTKVDRAAMAVSLETRVPFLDHRVVEFAWRLPLEYKLRGGTGKWLLRQVLYRHVPQALVDRPKTGFGIPLDAWLRGPLRDWAEALLDESRLRREGLFDPAPIRACWREHLAGRSNRAAPLWHVLMFQSWQESQ